MERSRLRESGQKWVNNVLKTQIKCNIRDTNESENETHTEVRHFQRKVLGNEKVQRRLQRKRGAIFIQSNFILYYIYKREREREREVEFIVLYNNFLVS